MALHTGGTDKEKALIRDLTDIAEPWCQCTILAHNGWPISFDEWQFRVTFDRLVCASRSVRYAKLMTANTE